MRKKTLITSLIGVLLLVGAGCSVDQPGTITTPDEINNQPNNNTTNPPTSADNPAKESVNKSSEIILTAITTENTGEVRLSWNAPANMDAERFQLTHGSTPGKTVADGAFWQNLPSNTTEFTWTGIKSGTRYFKVCELKDDTCLRTSNEVVLEVK